MKNFLARNWLQFRSKILRTLVVLVLALCIYSFFSFNWTSENFGVVEDGILYRSAEPGPASLRKWIKKYDIKTIVVLTSSIEKYEKKITEELNVTLHHIRMSSRRDPTDEQITQFLNVMADEKNHAALIHCRAGADRTGVMVAIWRIEMSKWTVNKTKKEMWYYKNILPRYRNFVEKRYAKNLKSNSKDLD